MIIKKDLLTVNPYSRSGAKLKSVKKIVIHYVANPGTTAKQNRNYFEMRKDGEYQYGSTHYILDDTEIIQCIPEDEVAYHVGAAKYTDYGLSISSYPNARTIGIEFCHPDETGKPEYPAYKHLVELCKQLCCRYKLDPMEDITTHNAITGKNCPKYYVDEPEEFYKFKLDVMGGIK